MLPAHRCGTRRDTMRSNHTSLPPPYDQALTPADCARYGAGLPARQADALRLRLAGFVYADIGARLGISSRRAHEAVRQACWLVSGAKQQAAPPTPPHEDTPYCRGA